MSLDAPLVNPATPNLIDKFRRDAVTNWLAKIDAGELEDAVMRRRDLGTSLVESVLEILWVRAHA